MFPIRSLASPLKPEQLSSFSTKRLYGIVSRAEALKSTLQHLVARQEYYDDDRRQYNPLVATQAAPGTGKSFLLDQLAELQPGDRVLEKIAGASVLVASWIPIPVTYNQFSAIDIDRKYSLSLDQGLAARMLFSYLMDFSLDKKATADLYSKFLSFITPTFESPSFGAQAPYLICDYILADSIRFKKSSVLLLVDELLKVGNQVDSLLKLIGEIQDKYSVQLRSVITSLDVSTLHNSQTKSGRRVLFVPLPLFPHKDVLVALANYLARTPKDDRFEFQVLIADCAGHARTLEKLCSLWDSQRKFKYIQADLLKAAFNPGRYRVEVAVCADRLPLRHMLATQSTIEDDIKAGYFINSVPELGVDEIIPQLSLLQLRRYSTEEPMASLVAIPTNPARVADGKAFEDFCLHWERVSRIYRHRDSATILGRYLRPSVSERSAAAFQAMKKIDLPLALGDLEIEKIDGQITANLASDKYKLGQIYYSNATNNPGFDYFYLAQSSEGPSMFSFDLNSSSFCVVREPFSCLCRMQAERSVGHNAF